MKKALKSIVCTLLIVSILGTTVCFAAGADELVYVSLGDSIADGIGLPANPLRGPEQENKNLIYCNKTEGAYPVLVAERLGINDSNFYQLACAGMRTVELRYCLDPGYVMPNKDANNFTGDELQTWVLGRFNYIDLVSRADIITMNMCANDIATCAIFAVQKAMAESGVKTEAIDQMIAPAMEKCRYFEALGTLLNYALTLDSYVNIAAAAIRGLTEGYTRWVENWDAICKRIYELNPDVKLICVGMYNPFNKMKLSDDSLLEIGAALDGIVAAVDSFSATGSRYASKYTYVSIMGIESMFAEQNKTFTDEDFLANLELNVHPSLTGQSQIADRVVSAVGNRNILSGIISGINMIVHKTASTAKGVLRILTSIFR